MNFNETSIPANYVEISKQSMFNILPEHVAPLYNVAFTAVAKFMQLVQEKGKVALALTDTNDTFICAAIVNFHPNEDEEMPGNYTLEFTFDEDDIDNAKVYNMGDTNFKNIVQKTAYDLEKIQFKKDTDIMPTIKYVFKALDDWLTANEDSVEHAVFIAEASVEEGVKFKSIVPSEVLKALIKSNATTEVE